MSVEAASLYEGTVVHARFGDLPRRFRYRLFSLAVDIDHVDAVAARLRWFSHNRRNLFSLFDRDHGAKDGTPMRPWINGVLARAGLGTEGRVILLCMPRVLGYGFNPLSLWYCFGPAGGLRAVLCEVRNTFGEWHGYLLHDDDRPLALPLRSRAAKVFHVSPFFPVSGEYRFRLAPPGEHFMTAIQYHDQGQLRLTATQHGRRRPLTDAALLGLAVRYPFMTLRVMAAIHWQALKLWWRGAPFHRKPPTPREEIT